MLSQQRLHSPATNDGKIRQTLSQKSVSSAVHCLREKGGRESRPSCGESLLGLESAAVCAGFTKQERGYCVTFL